jgi:hypothetical protein
MLNTASRSSFVDLLVCCAANLLRCWLALHGELIDPAGFSLVPPGLGVVLEKRGLE